LPFPVGRREREPRRRRRREEHDMTTQRSFKRLVRARMEKTGQGYTTARAALLAGDESPAPGGVALTVSDEAIRRSTGRGWEQWFDLLDAWGAIELSHRDIARRLAGQDGVDGWWAQSITVSYERARGRRAVGQAPDGFRVTASKTISAPVDRVYAAWVDPTARERWLPGGELRERTATKLRSARFDWGDGATRVNVGFIDKGDGRSTVALSHERLLDAAEAERMKLFWRERVAALKEELER
jgi:uncharacterized protein YndB with AHSA1/START domain